jgi:prepilin-type N-terminal cleavage/methylation domain-containing protein
MSFTHENSVRRGFSLVEILVAVSLLAVIMLGLMAMFYQTQRAFKIGSTQVDVAETGRATMQILTSELKQMMPSADPAVPGLFTSNRFPVLAQPRSFSPVPQENYLKDIFFFIRQNDQLIARGYFVEALTTLGGAGVLHQFEYITNANAPTAYDDAFREFLNPSESSVRPLTDRVIHLNLYAFDALGYPYSGNFFLSTNVGEIDFRTNIMPAYVEVELGVLEPKTYDRFRTRANAGTAGDATNYLAGRVDQVHLFRQRLPIRNVHETLF